MFINVSVHDDMLPILDQFHEENSDIETKLVNQNELDIEVQIDSITFLLF